MAEKDKLLEKPKREKVTGFRVELPDTPENQKLVGELTNRLTAATTRGNKNIGFGVGLKNGKIIVEAEEKPKGGV